MRLGRGISSHLEYPLHPFFPVAFEEKQFLVAIDRERTRHRRGERDLHGLPGRDLFLDRKAGLGIVNDYVMRHQHGHAPDGQFDRLAGPYDKMAPTYDAILTYVKENGLEIRGPSWEIYGDWDDDPAKLETEIVFRIA